MNHTENISNNESKTSRKISDTTVIKILICIIAVLVSYILGMQVIETIQAEDFYFTTDYYFTEPETKPEATDFKVNINSDNVFELTRLDGIGESKAKAIIEYRKENGDFVSIDELRNVKGIGDSLFEKIKNKLTLE